MALALMLQGTGSDVGKSILLAGMARAFTRRGLKVRPFKPQNMSNNAAVTTDGGEIGRAQALQARACGIPPTTDMNPVLLKPQSENGAQIILEGRVWGAVCAGEYHRLAPSLFPPVLAAFTRLAEAADLVLIEGAGSPAELNLRDGDIANIDVTVIVDGWHGDTSRMYGVGEVPARARRLVDVTYEGLARGLAKVKPGARLGDIGHAIQSYVESQRCSVVRDFCGHGVGRVFHDAPNVVHYGTPGTGPELRQGMFFTVEPMVNLGKYHVKLLADGWTAVTRDKSLSAQCEHSVGVTETGVELFTASPAGLFKPPIHGGA